MSDIKFYTPDYERMPLPSNGFGPQSLKELVVRPMTMREEKFLTNKSMVKNEKVQEEIFKSCVKAGVTTEGAEVPVEWNSFLSEDEYALLLFIRAISYGRDYEVSVTCPFCKKKTEITVDLERDISVAYAKADIKDGLDVTLPRSKKTVKMHYPTKKDVGNDVYETVANCIEASSGVEKHLIPMWMESLTAQDIAEMREAINNPGFGVSKLIAFKCEHDKCDSEGEEQKVLLPVTGEFFRISPAS